MLGQWCILQLKHLNLYNTSHFLSLLYVSVVSPVTETTVDVGVSKSMSFKGS